MCPYYVLSLCRYPSDGVFNVGVVFVCKWPWFLAETCYVESSRLADDLLQFSLVLTCYTYFYLRSSITTFVCWAIVCAFYGAVRVG